MRVPRLAFETSRLLFLVVLLVGCTRSEESRIETQAHDILRQSLRHENFFVRSASIKAIGEMGDSSFISEIVPGFRDPVAFVRLFAVESVAQLRGPDTLKLLLAAGHDPDPMVRTAVVKALDDLAGNSGQIDTLPIGQILTPFTKDPDPTVHLFAFATLARSGDQAGWLKLVQFVQSPDTAPPAVVALGRTKKKEALPILIKALQAEDSMTRTFAAEALGETANPEAYASLVFRIQNDHEPTVRGAAAISLGKIKNREAIPLLTHVLEEADPTVQLSAAEGLMRLGKNTQAVYAKALRHTDYGIRHSAIGSLHKIADKASLPLLIQALADDAPRVRIAAVRAIGSLGGKNEVPVLEKMLQDSDLAVRAYAAGNIVRLLRLGSSLQRSSQTP